MYGYKNDTRRTWNLANTCCLIIEKWWCYSAIWEKRSWCIVFVYDPTVWSHTMLNKTINQQLYHQPKSPKTMIYR